MKPTHKAKQNNTHMNKNNICTTINLYKQQFQTKRQQATYKHKHPNPHNKAKQQTQQNT